ncbi:hypothetical protein KY328_04835 [Candidatus Woesearchaeota archaeon]|nr:hypothetical protein [Candidatus Woesearchaeota archaeon]
MLSKKLVFYLLIIVIVISSINTGNNIYNIILKNKITGKASTAQVTFTIEPSFPVISNIETTIPDFKNGSELNATINFTSSRFPINFTFQLYDEAYNLISTSSIYEAASALELPVNYTIPSTLAQGNYTLNMTVVDEENNVVIENVDYFYVDLTDPIITSTTVFPRIVVLDDDVFINATATDNIGVDTLYAEITLPNSTIETLLIENINNYTTNITGTHNVTFYANDRAGNLATFFTDFIVAEPILYNISFVDFAISGINVTVSFFYPNDTEAIRTETFNGSKTIRLANSTYDMSVNAYDGDIYILVSNLNLASNNPNEFGIDLLATPITGYLRTFGINSTFLGIGGANITFGYAGLSYTDENQLHLYKCENWAFTSQSCLSTWTLLDSEINTNLNTIKVNVANFSGFSIKQEGISPPIGGPGPAAVCVPDWDCTDWGPAECPPSGIQTRTCTDLNSCGGSPPAESISCIYVPEEVPIAPPVEGIPIEAAEVAPGIYSAWVTEETIIVHPGIAWIERMEVRCTNITDNVEQILKIAQEPPEKSNFTKFDYLMGIEPSETLNCGVDIITEWLCIGNAYNLYKCKDWDFEKGICNPEQVCLNQSDKVTICHYAENPETITISCDALEQHLAHGDTVGECGNAPWDAIIEMMPGLQRYKIHIEPGDPGLGIGPSPIAQFCGDGSCNYGESCSNCQIDCGICVQQPTSLWSRLISLFTGRAVEGCTEDWSCGDWSAYHETGYRQRSCTDKNNCGTSLAKPAESEYCSYIDYGCNNGIKDQNEFMTDCGGVCEPCIRLPLKAPAWVYVIILLFITAFVLYYILRTKRTRALKKA